MGSALREEMPVSRVIRYIEEAVESANLLAMELTLTAFESDEMCKRMDNLDMVQDMVSRAMIATEEIGKLVGGLGGHADMSETSCTGGAGNGTQG